MTAILDHTGSPIVRTKRREMPAVRARYDAAQTHRGNENHWNWADSLSAAAANSPDVRLKLRNRSRYETANNTYASGMVRTLANDVVGIGPSLQMLSGNDEADSVVETAFYHWTRAIRLAEKLIIMRSAKCVDGEGFGVKTTNFRLNNPVKLDLRLYEAEQVARPWTDLSDPLQTDGIILDDFGNPLAYTLLDHHPGDLNSFGLGLGGHELIPANQMIHLFKCERPGQVRGVPEITSALPLYAQLRRYTLAVIAAAETAANMAGVLQTQEATQDPDDLEPLDLFDVERNSFMTMPRGWALNQLKAEQPVTTYAMFKREIINEIARCLNMPYNVAAGDSSSYNYASGRLDHKTYFKAIRVDRSHIELVVLESLFSDWWREAALVGLIPAELSDWEGPPPHEWRWDGDEHVDPLKEANAQQVRLANHTTTLAREFSRQGLDWEDELRQRAKEKALMEQLGLSMSATESAIEEEGDA